MQVNQTLKLQGAVGKSLDFPVSLNKNNISWQNKRLFHLVAKEWVAYLRVNEVWYWYMSGLRKTKLFSFRKSRANDNDFEVETFALPRFLYCSVTPRTLRKENLLTSTRIIQ